MMERPLQGKVCWKGEPEGLTDRVMLSTAAFLEFFPTAARTGIVARLLYFRADKRLLFLNFTVNIEPGAINLLKGPFFMVIFTDTAFRKMGDEFDDAISIGGRAFFN